jgi:hypothetical protein
MVKDIKTGHVYCSKHFPKEFSDKTVVNESGYPIYCQHYDPNIAFIREFKGKQVRINNQWVVPYNPYLTSHYKAHINVEICALIHVIKYICKYIYKGPDQTILRLELANNEVDLYLQAHYYSPTEGYWQIFEYYTHEEWPPIIKFTVHLPDQHTYTFKKHDTPEQHVARKEKACSTLIAFFK